MTVWERGPGLHLSRLQTLIVSLLKQPFLNTRCKTCINSKTRSLVGQNQVGELVLPSVVDSAYVMQEPSVTLNISIPAIYPFYGFTGPIYDFTGPFYDLRARYQHCYTWHGNH